MPLTQSFRQAWLEYEQRGFRYGQDALEQVSFGYDMAHKEIGDMPLRYAVCCIELGLRWLHDSVERDRRRNRSRRWQDPAGKWYG